MERAAFDALSAVVLFATALLGAFIPKHLDAHGATQPGSYATLLYHLGNCLSAGVMLSAGLCHLLADSLRQLSFIGHFPIATFLCGTGYLVTLLADQVVQMVMARGDEGAGHDHLHYTAVGSGSPAHGAGGRRAAAAPLGGCRSIGDGVGDGDAEVAVACSDALLSPLGKRTLHHHHHHPSAAAAPAAAAARHPHGHSHAVYSGRSESFEHVLELEPGGPAAAAAAAAAPAAHNHFQVLLSGRRLSFATALLLAGALCIHSVLEGMALGAQPTLRGTEDIFLAIVAHKGLAAYALGASIVESRASNGKFWVTISLFSLATPAGIALGYVFAQHGGGVGAAVSALAAGTFLYVALMEVIPKEFDEGDMRHRGAKVAAMLLGFGLMSLLAVWA